jgi:hypothetical protein
MHEPPGTGGDNVVHIGDFPRRLAELESNVGELLEMRDAIAPVFRAAAEAGGATPPAPQALLEAFCVPPGNGVIDVLIKVGGHMERIEVDTDQYPHAHPDAVYAALLARPCGA